MVAWIKHYKNMISENNMHNFRTLTLVTLLFGLSGLSLASTMYKWVDANGGVHYSQTPPKGKYTVINSQTQQIVASNQTSQADATNSKPTATSQPTTQANNAPVRLSTSDCSTLGQTLATLQSGQRVYESDANGQRAYVTDDQRAQQIQQYQQEMSSACQ